MQALNSPEVKLLKKIGKISFWILSILGPIGIIFLGSMAVVMGMVSDNETTEGNPNVSLGNGVPSEFIADYNYAAQVSGIPNWVLAAITKHESTFRVEAVSSAGAYGLMQFRKLESNGSNNWEYSLNKGLDKWLKEAGFNYSNSEEAWSTYLTNSKMQILTGAFVLMEKGYYALKKEGVANVIDDPFNVENMKLFPWNAEENDPAIRNPLRRMFVMYNYGQGGGANVDLDAAESNYPNRVYATAMEFRSGGLEGGTVNADGVVGKAIEIGKSLIGRTTYVYGGGRNQSDIDKGYFDCSSSIHYMYKQAGLELGPVTSATTYTLIQKGRAVSIDELKPGDLIFFNTEGTNSHMGMYIGLNQFIHCADPGGVKIAEFNSFWRGIFHGATRIVE
ncbi:MAG: NlpC/P60 family protein [Clostridium sp.]